MKDYEKIKLKLALMGLKIRPLYLNVAHYATIIELDGQDSDRTVKDGFYIFHQAADSYEEAEKLVLDQWVKENGKL